MDQQTFDNTYKCLQLAAEILTVSGGGVALVKWLQAHGVKMQDFANNKLVGAAERLAPGLLQAVLVQGKSITDPAVVAQVQDAIVAALTASHAATIATAGAAGAGLAVIAKNAVEGEAKATTDATLQSASTSVDPIAAVQGAKALLTAVSAAAAPIGATA